jgi:LmbE family N-acetylglucosaminyl deacetylase
MNVLAIGCHPDDIEVACAGTLAKYTQQGHKVTVCHVANGDLGHAVIMPPELRLMRREEAKKAGSLAGIEVVTCDIGDVMVYEAQKEQRDLVVDVIRTYQPDVIITHSPNDYMPDHTAVSKLVFDATFAASVPHYKTRVDGVANITPLYYMDTLAGVNFTPAEYVDITDTLELKIEMLECHESQMKWMRDHDNIDFAEFVTACARFRGLQCGAKYAEAFTSCNAWPKVVPKRMLP